jgi:hypothetical protein
VRSRTAALLALGINICMKYIVYKITNTINGKYYIGVHKTNDINDDYFGSGVYLKRAIAKHGKEFFNKSILHIFDNSVDAFNKEKELVVVSEDSYNLKEGGCGGFDHINNVDNNPHHTTEHSNYMHNALESKKRSDPEFAKKYRQKISDGVRRRINQDSELKQRLINQILPYRITSHTDETKKKISSSLKGKHLNIDNSNAKAVCAAGKMYGCFKAAKDELNISEWTLRKRLKSEKYLDWYYVDNKEF